MQRYIHKLIRIAATEECRSTSTRFYSLCNEKETTDRAAKREYLIFNDNFGILKKSEELNKGNTVCFHEANQIWKFYI